ncbi:MAG: RNA polymerase sigma factor [Phycisphaerales bacterium]
MSVSQEHEDLLAKALKGDRAALIDLLEAFGPMVRARIEPKIGAHLRPLIEADDIMQVTYMEAVTRLDSFTSGGAKGFLAWVTRIAENNLTDAARAADAAKRPDPRKRITGGDANSSMIAMVEHLGMTVTTPSRAAATGEAVSALERTLARLPEIYAKVIRLYDLEQWPVDEVAEEIGRSEGAVYMLRARAHERLRDLLGSESQYFTKIG